MFYGRKIKYVYVARTSSLVHNNILYMMIAFHDEHVLTCCLSFDLKASFEEQPSCDCDQQFMELVILFVFKSKQQGWFRCWAIDLTLLKSTAGHFVRTSPSPGWPGQARVLCSVQDQLADQDSRSGDACCLAVADDNELFY